MFTSRPSSPRLLRLFIFTGTVLQTQSPHAAQTSYLGEALLYKVLPGPLTVGPPCGDSGRQVGALRAVCGGGGSQDLAEVADWVLALISLHCWTGPEKSCSAWPRTGSASVLAS